MVVGVVLVIGIALLIYAITGDDVPADASEHLVMTERESMHSVSEKWESAAPAEWKKLMDAVQERPYTGNTEVGLNLSIEGEMSLEEQQGIEMIEGLLSETTLQIESKEDFPNRESYSVVTGELLGVEFPETNLLIDGENLGLKIARFYEDYLYFPLDKYGEVMRMIDTDYVGPEEIPLEDPWEQFSFQGMSAEAGDKMLEHLQENLREEHVEVSDATYESPEGEVEVQKLSVELGEDEALEVFQGWLGDLEEDSEMMEELIGDIEENMEMYSTEDMPEMDFKENLQESLEELRDAVYFPDGFNMTLLLDGNRVVDREISFTAAGVEADESMAFSLETESWVYEDGEEEASGRLEIEPAEGGNFWIEYLYGESVPEGEVTARQDLTLSAGMEEPGEGSNMDLFELDYTRNSSHDPDSGEIYHDYDFLLELTPGTPEELTLNGYLEQVIDQDLEEDYHRSDNELGISFGLPGQFGETNQVELAMTFDMELEFQDQIDIPALDEDEAVNIVEVDEGELEEIMAEIEQNAMLFIDEFAAEFMGAMGLPGVAPEGMPSPEGTDPEMEEIPPEVWEDLEEEELEEFMEMH